MRKKSLNEANFVSLLSKKVSGQVVGYVFQKNGRIRANNRVLVKRSRKNLES